MSVAPAADSAAPPAAPSPRLLPDSHRYRWEQQWLRENRDAARVIANADRAPARTAATTRPQPGTTTARAAAPMPQPEPTALATTAAPAAPRPAAQLAQAIAGYRSAAGDSAVPAAATNARIEPRAPVAALPAAKPPRRTAARRADPRRFGLWLEGDEVTLSLRLEPIEAGSWRGLEPLRRWLGGLGLRLRAAIVNGVLRWHRDDAPPGH